MAKVWDIIIDDSGVIVIDPDTRNAYHNQAGVDYIRKNILPRDRFRTDYCDGDLTPAIQNTLDEIIIDRTILTTPVYHCYYPNIIEYYEIKGKAHNIKR